MTTSHPLISIVVPVYNVAPQLGRCLDSILRQDFRDFELILVDDGSRDSSGEICDRYASQHPCIQVIHQANGGVSAARNAGIRRAQGEWIYFADSDDWMEHDLLSTFQSYLTPDTDLYLIGAAIEYDGHTTFVTPHAHHYTRMDEALVYLYQKNLVGVPWNKLFRRRIVETYHLTFCEALNSYEDELFNLEYCQHVTSVRTIPYHGYHYLTTSNDQSLSKRILTHKERKHVAGLLYDAARKISDNPDYVAYLGQKYAFHIYDSVEIYYKKAWPAGITRAEKREFLLLCYTLLHENDFCSQFFPPKRVWVLKLIFLCKHAAYIQPAFQLDLFRIKLSKWLHHERI